MSTYVEMIDIDGDAPGIRYSVQAHHFGNRDAGGRAYIQAGLHAGEFPGVMAAHHLIARLETAAAQRRMRGSVTVVPCANPIALNRSIERRLPGRLRYSGQSDFNRDFPDLSEAVMQRIRGNLTWDIEENTNKVRQVLKEAIAELPSATEPADRLRRVLLGQAIDADYVVDLHCDDLAPVHMYVAPERWSEAEELAARAEVKHVFTTDRSGDLAFDTACTRPWLRLDDWVDDARPLSAGCLAVTLELRGRGQVNDDLGKRDADAIYRFLQSRRIIKGEAGKVPELDCTVSAESGISQVVSPASGMAVHQVDIGDRIYEGDLTADIIDPASQDRIPVFAQADGVVWSLSSEPYVLRGDILLKTAAVDDPEDS